MPNDATNPIFGLRPRAIGLPGFFGRHADPEAERDKGDLDDLLASVEQALRIDDPDEALALCRQAQASHPDDLRPWLAVARTYIEWARADEARDVLDRASRMFGAQPEILARRITLARQCGDLALRRELAEAAKDGQRCFPLWVETVRFAIDVGRYDWAREALRSPPAAGAKERAEARVLFGQLEAARGHHGEALRHFRQAFALDPLGHFQVHVEIARTGLLALEIDLAREHMKRVLEAQTLPPAKDEEPWRFSRSRIAAEIGQMLDEFGFDEALAARLRALGLEPPGRQVAQLRAVVVENPGHTAPAIRLLQALRRRGDLADGSTSRSQGIPRRIVQYWDFTPPREVAALMRSWTDFNPDWQYRLFDDSAAVEFLRAHGAPGALAAYRGAVHPAQRADIFRLAYLAVEGGFYADADDRCLAPLDTWAPVHASFVGYFELCGAVANNCLAVAPRHPAILLALAHAIEAIDRGENQAIWRSTGPGQLTRALARAMSADAALFGESVLLDLCTLQTRVAIHCHLPYKKTDRHWARAEMGRRDGPERRTGVASGAAPRH